MFMNTMAVGPFAPRGTCAGATVAFPLLHCALYDERIDVAGVTAVARFAAREQDIRRAIVEFATRKKASSRSVCIESVSRRPEHQGE
jgi:hypothetical protein